MRRWWGIAALLVASSAAVADDHCDIALRPAATLLLPYFDVDVKAPQPSAAQTLFTIQNTSRFPQIAGVTLWTDWGFPVLHFNVFLTGYDVQGINLYDVLVRATIAGNGTSSNITVPTNPSLGSQPEYNDANPRISTINCDHLPGIFAEFTRQELEALFTTGKVDFCNKPAGDVHAHAIGYATIDVKSRCSLMYPNSPAYWSEVLYDNVLTGDYQQITPRNGRLSAQGGPLVHIRAVPDGGPAGAVPGTPLAHTFYERYAAQKSDRRQPLPSVFAPRFVNSGNDGISTTLKIWREGFAAAGPACGAYGSNSSVPFDDVVRFDEHENATLTNGCPSLCGPPGGPSAVAAIDAFGNYSGFLPWVSTAGDAGGWLYFNFGRQSWVVESLSAPEINPTDILAASLANGCTPPPKPGAQIGPAP